MPTNNIRNKVCADGEVTPTLAALKASRATMRANAKFGHTTDIAAVVSVGVDSNYASVYQNGNLAGEDSGNWTVTGYARWKPASGLTDLG